MPIRFRKSDRAVIKYLVKNTPMTKEELDLYIYDILLHIKEQMIGELEGLIYTIVPRATGELQDDMVEKMYKLSKSTGKIVEVVVGTDKVYAMAIGLMNDANVQHFGEIAYPVRGELYYGRTELDDPAARANFADILQRYMTEITPVIIDRIYVYWFSGTGSPEGGD